MTKLTAMFVDRTSDPGYHGDDACAGLYLQVTEGAGGIVRKSWIFRYTSPTTRKRREMGLGCLQDRSLREARVKARECRNQVLELIDPLDFREERRRALRLAQFNTLSFDQASKKYIDTHKVKWSNAKHAEQWSNTLKTYASPVIGNLSVAEITTRHIIAILEANNFWNTKTETAKRVLQRISAVFEWCKAMNYMQGDNPAQWKGNIDKILPNPQIVAKVKHHIALPFNKIQKFISDLRRTRSTGNLALEFLILTAARTNEVTQAKWAEIDFEKNIWIIPATRTKMKREHRVPLTPRALEILKEMYSVSRNEFIFPGWGLKSNKGLSNNVFLKLIDKMPGYASYTAHGFRSTFADWAAESTSFPRETIELALAHVIKNKAQAAYIRMDQLEKRMELMKEWEMFINQEQ